MKTCKRFLAMMLTLAMVLSVCAFTVSADRVVHSTIPAESLVLGVGSFTGKLQGNVVSLGVVDLLVTGLDIPLTPGSDDLHIGSKALDGQLKTDLVIALAGAAVADRVSAFLKRDVYQALSDAGTGVAGAQQILFVNSAGLHAGDDVVINIFIGLIQNVQFGSTGL